MKKKVTLSKFITSGKERVFSIIKLNPYRNLKAWDYQKNIIKDAIHRDDVVLDIGSGNNPTTRANILADFSPDDNFHRSGNLKEDKPVIVCSVERIPLLKKSINFVLCSHVLEHVNQPQKACEELQRISHKGFVETPAYGKDILVGTGYMHKWQVVSFENELHFFEYSLREHVANHDSSPAIKLWWRKRYHPWQKYFWERQDLFNAWLLWEETFKVSEYRRKGLEVSKSFQWSPVEEKSLPVVPVRLTENEIALLSSVISTPDGKLPMKYVGESFINEETNIVYPIRGKRIYVEMGI